MKTQTPSTTPTKILRKSAVIERVGLSDSTIRRLELTGKFPRSIPLGAHSVGWLESDIEAWIQTRAQSRQGAADHAGEIATHRVTAPTAARLDGSPLRRR